MKKNKPDLESLRKNINDIDSEILTLLNRRTKEVIAIGEAKKKVSAEFYVPKREQEVYRRLIEKNTGPFPNSALKTVYREIMSASLRLEKPVRVVFLGPVATFTHQACIQHFGLSVEFLPQKEIADVFEAVEKGRADFGVVPIENTAEGVVTHTLDMFVSSTLTISAEIMLEVSLALLNKTGSLADVKTVSSHPHALAQCRNWLKANISEATFLDTSSTAMAAKMASEDESSAAVASLAAADLYNLRVLENHIEDTPHNLTRFLVVGRQCAKETGDDKTSIVFAIKDAPGALYDMLEPFARRGINLTKIESRPIKTRVWEYLFFIDLDGHINEARVREAVEELRKVCSFMKTLGSYPMCHGPESGD
ncbi:MAG: prephenate dehydratase [Thermodesulfobacteriota bacterium]